MVVTACAKCKCVVWRAMDGKREKFFERAEDVFCFRGGTQGGLAVAVRATAMYRVHKCRNVGRREGNVGPRASGKGFR